MAGERVHRMSHSVDLAAPAGVVYGLIADAVRWPLFFPPNVHVERLEFDGTNERLRMWATANGEVRSWLSHRVQDSQDRLIEFRQQNAQAPVESMNGTWIVQERGTGASVLTLLHDFTVVGNRAEDVAWAELATDTNTRSQLANIKRLAESWPRLDELVLSFEDSVRVNGPAELVYDFLYRVSDWPELIPHVTRLDLTEDVPGVQVMAMDTRTADGSVHTTESVRVCFPHAGRIVYKQTTPPALMAAHTGEWSVLPDESGVSVVSQHSVVLREEAVAGVLGPEADLARARRYVREALGRNSTVTLNLAKRHAESAVRML
ncbi:MULTISPECIES: aromatase/cyclase [unclassified Streptomyces]|uniref:aromatase/cyclase n=1 Tax=unclassified Streptomyces TaxID=2593676 RepID=UPI002DD9B95B|nr:aromatase/cyclase [Streptomyces sp. NBC_01750]WSA98254.1 aromatase/cyclase [Streptomyces sp. NBC_01794]WSD37209.1 aromatase/cyclase [Streptomyces sp. NBC_01750]